MTGKYVIGLDYGTDSGRAVIINAENGDELASSVMYYPRWKESKYCDPARNQYRQHPQDYIDVFEFTVKDALSKCLPSVAGEVVGISIDTTGSTPVMTNKEGIPLALTEGFEENPNAMFVLWKDHTAVKEANEINQLAGKWEVDYTKYEGGVYSSEWVWAKVLHVLRTDEKVRDASVSWIEHCDWLPGILCGKLMPNEVYRSRCAAGHKSMWHPDWKGLPPEEFLTGLDPLLKGYRSNLYDDTYTSDVKAGNLTTEWADKLGLTTNVAIGVGAFDCHMGAVGGEASPNVLTRSIGTSTCDIMTVRNEDIGSKLIAGICGQVDGSVIPGYMGLEAGQSAFGDVYAWFKQLIAWPVVELMSDTELIDQDTKNKLIEETLDKIIPSLSAEAMKIPIEESSILALDWLNGRRTPDASQEVKGAITGLTLGSSAPRVFRALVEATAFGSKAIVDRFSREGVMIKEIIGLGGVAKKSPFVMQTLADVLNMPIKIASTEQTCATGAAMFAAVVGGVYDKVEDAQKAMGKGFEKTYYPISNNTSAYDTIYKKYLELGEFVEKNTGL
jgi:L-ribulokinase